MSARGWLAPIAVAAALHGAVLVTPVDLETPVASEKPRVTLRAMAAPTPASATPSAPAARALPAVATPAPRGEPPTPPTVATAPTLGPPAPPEPAAQHTRPGADDGVAGSPPETSTLAGQPSLAPVVDRAALHRYAAEVRQQMTRQKRYPPRAARLGLEGSARVRLAITSSGNLAEPPRLSRSSGHAILDAEAIRMARAGAPYPAPPAERPRGPLSVEVPVRFSAPR